MSPLASFFGGQGPVYVDKEERSKQTWLYCMTLLGHQAWDKEIHFSYKHCSFFVGFFPHKNANLVSYARTRIQNHPPSHTESSQRAYIVTQYKNFTQKKA